MQRIKCGVKEGMTTKQATLAQLNAATKASRKADTAFNKIEMKPNATQAQYDAAKARAAKADAKYWEMVESVTDENPEYSEIINNGHYEC